jgi:hypothetical protein
MWCFLCARQCVYSLSELTHFVFIMTLCGSHFYCSYFIVQETEKLNKVRKI